MHAFTLQSPRPLLSLAAMALVTYTTTVSAEHQCILTLPLIDYTSCTVQECLVSLALPLVVWERSLHRPYTEMSQRNLKNVAPRHRHRSTLGRRLGREGRSPLMGTTCPIEVHLGRDDIAYLQPACAFVQLGGEHALGPCASAALRSPAQEASLLQRVKDSRTLSVRI